MVVVQASVLSERAQGHSDRECASQLPARLSVALAPRPGCLFMHWTNKRLLCGAETLPLDLKVHTTAAPGQWLVRHTLSHTCTYAHTHTHTGSADVTRTLPHLIAERTCV